jgi:lipoprotein-anchoring transpeptidase ErfK/SrfK
MTKRRVAAAAGLTGAALAGAAALVVLTRSDAPDTEPARAPPAASAPSAEQVPRPPPRRSRGTTLRARLVRPVLLRERPGGRIVRSLGLRTEFGSRRVLAVVEQRPGWLGVLTPHMPNSRTGWIPADGARLRAQPYTLRVDLSARTLVVRSAGRVRRRIKVAIGRPGTDTPTGRFAITDLLIPEHRGGPYGCCALALTGRQPNVPQGWSGGDRLAIHGTPNERTIGTPASNGCLRAGEADMRWLLANMPLGAPVRIAA